MTKVLKINDTRFKFGSFTQFMVAIHKCSPYKIHQEKQVNYQRIFERNRENTKGKLLFIYLDLIGKVSMK